MSFIYGGRGEKLNANYFNYTYFIYKIRPVKTSRKQNRGKAIFRNVSI